MFESFVWVTSKFRRTTGHYNVGLTLKYLKENICIMPLSIVDYTEIFSTVQHFQHLVLPVSLFLWLEILQNQTV